ncbi:transporter, partial [Pseudomonas corrugata]
MNPIRTTFALQMTLGLACSCALPALATENGVDNIGPGTDGFFVLPLEVDSLPDNMVAFNLYYNHYKARTFNISSLGGKVPGVEIESTAVIPRIDYLSPLRFAGGRLGIYVAQPWIKQEVALFGMSDTREGMGDTTISPIVLWDMGKNLT